MPIIINGMICSFFLNIQIFDIKKYAFGKPGFIDTEKFYSDFQSFIKEDDFNTLKKSFSITATDILNGNLKTFNLVEMIKPILASAAFSVVFAPVKIGDSYYIDGEALNNFPVENLISKCDIIIGFHISGYNYLTIKDLKCSYNIIELVFKLKSVQEDYEKFKDCDLVVLPKQLDSYGTFEKKQLQKIFRLGYYTTKEALNNNAITK
jgi:NTE family protein